MPYYCKVCIYGRKGSVHGSCLNLKWSNNGWKYIDAFYTYSGKKQDVIFTFLVHFINVKEM